MLTVKPLLLRRRCHPGGSTCTTWHRDRQTTPSTSSSLVAGLQGPAAPLMLPPGASASECSSCAQADCLNPPTRRQAHHQQRACCRGLRTALVEREDFASGTSSKSTKLVHGGVRYLEKAVFNADMGQLKLVFEALHERKRLLQNAPHLCSALPIMTVGRASLELPCPLLLTAWCPWRTCKRVAARRQQQDTSQAILAGHLLRLLSLLPLRALRACPACTNLVPCTPGCWWPPHTTRLRALHAAHLSLSCCAACMQRKLTMLCCLCSPATSGGRCPTTGRASRRTTWWRVPRGSPCRATPRPQSRCASSPRSPRTGPSAPASRARCEQLLLHARRHGVLVHSLD